MLLFNVLLKNSELFIIASLLRFSSADMCYPTRHLGWDIWNKQPLVKASIDSERIDFKLKCLQSPAALLIILSSQISLICTVGETHYCLRKMERFSIRILFIDLSVDYYPIIFFSSLWLYCWCEFLRQPRILRADIKWIHSTTKPGSPAMVTFMDQSAGQDLYPIAASSANVIVLAVCKGVTAKVKFHVGPTDWYWLLYYIVVLSCFPKVFFFFSYTLVYGSALLFLECGMMGSSIVLEAFATR